MKYYEGIAESFILGLIAFLLCPIKPLLAGILVFFLVYFLFRLNKNIIIHILRFLISIFILGFFIYSMLIIFPENTIPIIIFLILSLIFTFFFFKFPKYSIIISSLIFLFAILIFNFLYNKETKKIKTLLKDNLEKKREYIDLSNIDIKEIYELILPYYFEISGEGKKEKKEISWDAVYNDLLNILNNLEKEDTILFKPYLENESEERDELKILKLSRINMVVVYHFLEKKDFQKAEEILKKQTKIFEKIFILPQETMISTIVIDAILKNHLNTEVFFSFNLKKPFDFKINISSEEYLKYIRNSLKNDLDYLFNFTEKEFAKIEKNIIIKIFFEKISSFFIYNFYNSLLDERNFQDWEFANKTLNKNRHFGIMAKISMPNTKNFIKSIWITSALIKSRDAYFHYLKTNKFPEDIEDPFTKKPVKFLKGENFILIYSLGPDMEDQAGNPLHSIGIFKSHIKQDIGYKIP